MEVLQITRFHWGLSLQIIRRCHSIHQFMIMNSKRTISKQSLAGADHLSLKLSALNQSWWPLIRQETIQISRVNIREQVELKVLSLLRWLLKLMIHQIKYTTTHSPKSKIRDQQKIMISQRLCLRTRVARRMPQQSQLWHSTPRTPPSKTKIDSEILSKIQAATTTTVYSTRYQ
jgi:hypothetical protein